jgi:cell wall assembly regulator SMI1
MLFRLQAASYNTFLPTFRAHVVQQANTTPVATGLSQEEMMAKVEEWRNVAQRIAAGDTNALGEMFQTMNISFVGGILLGGVAASLLSQMNTPKEPEEPESL